MSRLVVVMSGLGVVQHQTRATTMGVYRRTSSEHGKATLKLSQIRVLGAEVEAGVLRLGPGSGMPTHGSVQCHLDLEPNLNSWTLWHIQNLSSISWVRTFHRI